MSSLITGSKADLFNSEVNAERYVLTTNLKKIPRWNLFARFLNQGSLNSAKVAQKIEETVKATIQTKPLNDTQKTQAISNIKAMEEKFSKTTNKTKALAISTALTGAREVIKTQPLHTDTKPQVIENIQAIEKSPVIQDTYSNQACYFDMGGLSSCIWSFITWSNTLNSEVFEIPQFNSYLQNLFTNMKNAGMNQIDLAFAQLSDVDAFSTGDYSKISGNDVIGALLEQMKTSNISFPPNTDILNLITNAANAAGVKVSLSLGGENATSADFAVCKPGETPEGQAQKLADFMNAYNIASVDFDVEGTNAGALSQESGIQLFFTTLHTALNTTGKTVTLTIQGSLSQTVWGTGTRGNPSSFNGPLKPLFYDVNNNPIANTLFDGINLMMYDSGAHYYLDDKGYSDDTINPDWCVEDWLNIVQKENAGMIHIGFQDATAYQLAASSASGHTYYTPTVPCPPSWAVQTTDSTGTAGAKILLQMQAGLTADGYATELGAPFWWPNYDGNRYSPTGDFVSQPMNDFYTTLEQLGGQSSAEKAVNIKTGKLVSAIINAHKSDTNNTNL